MRPNLPSRRQFVGQSLSLAALATAAPRLAFPQQTVESHATTKVASGQRGVVATVHPLASRAAIAAFDRGGNAIDAAVAASLMLSVVDGFNSGIGGGCLAMIRLADGTMHAIDGRETAPIKARPEIFFRNGQPDPQLSQIGPLAAGVPGLLATLDRLSSEYGAADWRDALEGAATVAEDGFLIDDNYASRLRSAASRLKQFPESARILLDPSGQALKSGEVLRQTDLAATLRSLAEQGVEWFYQGEFARQIARFMNEQGGLLDEGDFASYKTLARTAIETNYHGNRVFGFPPPSSGGIHVAQMLGMLSGFDVPSLFAESEAKGRHLLLEVMKRAMADRAYWLGDADFAKVPRGLLDLDYLADRASTIDLSRATEVKSHGIPPRADVDLFGAGGHTTHLSTADALGNIVTITQTVNTTFGCKMIVPGTGVILNNEMDDFSIAPGVRNAFGLLGSEANLIAPGKRPLSSMSPSIVLDDSRNPMLACGAAGGPKIITTVLQILVRVLDLKQTIDEAIAAPRCHHQWSPNEAVCENAVDPGVISELERYGHVISKIGSAAVAQGVSISSATLTAASDPRVPSAAISM